MGFNNIGYLEKDKQVADSAKLQGKQIGTNSGDVMAVGAFGIGSTTELENVDANNVIVTKPFFAGSACANRPFESKASTNGAHIFNIERVTGVVSAQIGLSQKTNHFAWRTKSTGWQAWEEAVGTTLVQTLSGKKMSFQNANDASPTVLDWYEEGTFTPTVQGGVTLGTGTYSTQQGRYTRIGNKVFFDITVGVSAHNGTGQLQIAGLPFVLNATQESSVSISYMSMLSFAYIPLAHVYPNSATVRLLRTVANSTPVYLVFSDITGYPFELRISGHYTAA